MTNPPTRADIAAALAAQAKRRLLDTAVAVPQDTTPRVVLIVGQPGSGIRTTARHLANRFDANSDHHMVRISQDQIRRLHPDYPDLVKTLDGEQVYAGTETDSRHAYQAVVHQARELRLNTVVEAHPADAATFARDFIDAGYHVEAVFQAASKPVSRLNLLRHYAEQVHQAGTGYVVPTPVHDHAHDVLPQIAATIESQGLAHNITVRGNHPGYLYANTRDDTGIGWMTKPAAAKTILTEQTRRWSLEESKAFGARVFGVARWLTEHHAPHLQDISKLADTFHHDDVLDPDSTANVFHRLQRGLLTSESLKARADQLLRSSFERLPKGPPRTARRGVAGPDTQANPKPLELDP